MQLGNEVVFPAAGYFAMAIEAVTQMVSDSEGSLEIQSFTLKNMSIQRALVVPDDEYGVETLFALHSGNAVRTHSVVSPARRQYTFSVSSVAMQGSTWNEHATGTIRVNMAIKGKSRRVDWF